MSAMVRRSPYAMPPAPPSPSTKRYHGTPGNTGYPRPGATGAAWSPAGGRSPPVPPGAVPAPVPVPPPGLSAAGGDSGGTATVAVAWLVAVPTTNTSFGDRFSHG